MPLALIIQFILVLMCVFSDALPNGDALPKYQDIYLSPIFHVTEFFHRAPVITRDK